MGNIIINSEESEKCKIRMGNAYRANAVGADIILSELTSLGALPTLSVADKQYLLYIIDREEFELRHIKILDNTLRSMPSLDAELYIDVMVNLARFQLDLDLELVKGSTNALCRINTEDFQYAIVGLITHSNGYVRRLGRSVWDQYKLQDSSVDITITNKDIQLSFIISMLQDGGDPEIRLPKVLPLLDSDDEIIPLILLHQLKPYTLNYRGHIITQIDKLDIQNRNAVESIKEYFSNISNFANERSKCKELNPEYNQMAIVREFTLGFQEYIKPLFGDRKNSSIMNLFKPVQLARGLCSRDTNGNEIELPLIKTSVPAQTMNSSFSYLEMIQQSNKMLMDWNSIKNAEDLWKIL